MELKRRGGDGWPVRAGNRFALHTKPTCHPCCHFLHPFADLKSPNLLVDDSWHCKVGWQWHGFTRHAHAKWGNAPRPPGTRPHMRAPPLHTTCPMHAPCPAACHLFPFRSAT